MLTVEEKRESIRTHLHHTENLMAHTMADLLIAVLVHHSPYL